MSQFHNAWGWTANNDFYPFNASLILDVFFMLSRSDNQQTFTIGDHQPPYVNATAAWTLYGGFERCYFECSQDSGSLFSKKISQLTVNWAVVPSNYYDNGTQRWYLNTYFHSVYFDLAPYVSQTLTFRFRCTSDNGNFGYTFGLHDFLSNSFYVPLIM